MFVFEFFPKTFFISQTPPLINPILAPFSLLLIIECLLPANLPKIYLVDSEEEGAEKCDYDAKNREDFRGIPEYFLEPREEISPFDINNSSI